MAAGYGSNILLQIKPEQRRLLWVIFDRIPLCQWWKSVVCAGYLYNVCCHSLYRYCLEWVPHVKAVQLVRSQAVTSIHLAAITVPVFGDRSPWQLLWAHQGKSKVAVWRSIHNIAHASSWEPSVIGKFGNKMKRRKKEWKKGRNNEKGKKDLYGPFHYIKISHSGAIMRAVQP